MTRVWEALSVLGLFGMFYILALHWSDLPDRVPSHFDAAGNADRWTGPYRLWFMPVMAVILYAVLSWVARSNLRFNVPFGLDSRQPDVRDEVVTMLTAMKAFIMLGSLWIHAQVLMIAMGLLKSPGPLSFVVTGAALGLTSVVYVWRLWRLSKVAV